jgi:uncharacterized membrane protein
MEALELMIQNLGDWIAMMGIFIVILGVVVTVVRFVKYLFTGFSEERSAKLRHSLMIYLSLGLDFLIAKDVIVTLALDSGDIPGLIQLGAVIVIRILLSFFVHLEEKVLHRVQSENGPKSKKSSSSKKNAPKKRRFLMV